MNTLEKRLEALAKELQKTKIQKSVRTIPEVFGFQYKENYITRWIAFLLNQGSLGKQFIEAFISLSGDDISISENDNIEVYTEYVFADQRRIDILIVSNNLLIGIENKLWSGEQVNQTEDYSSSLNKIAEGRKWLGIYLHPEWNKSESKHFKNITYTQLWSRISKIDINNIQIDDFTLIMFNEFKKYIGEWLMMKNNDFPIMTERAKLYLQYAEDIRLAADEYEEYKKKAFNWIKEQFENAGYHPTNSPSSYHYWIIVRNDNWRKIDFHYELLWEGELLEAEDLQLDIHLEKKQIVSEEKLRQVFDINNVKGRSVNNPLIRERITCNFKTKEDAEKTIQTIIHYLNSVEFEEWAKKADDAISLLSIHD